MSTAAPLARSNTFFGAIKNIVTAPFNWLAGSEDEFEDARGKRRRLQVIPEDTHMEDESIPSRAKRMRVDSPDRDIQPYLDPPRSAFAQPRRTSDLVAPGAARDITSSPRKTHRMPSTSNQAPRYRTLSPLPSVSQLSPRRLRVRSSLTPQPSGTAFGPVVPPRRERGPDEPPPLTTLMSNPMFVRPPPGVQKQGAAEPPRQLTLGTLIDTQRTARTPSRQSSILFGTGSMTDVSAPGHSWPVNKAEIALHELEVYKTPLLPTRLKGASAVPDMFLHKERKHITLMTDDRPAKPRLGTKGKGKEKGKGRKKEKEILNGTKPYAGEGGMKKWLARRKKEEEETGAEAEEKKREEELNVPPPPPIPVFEPRATREESLGSSIRVGRTRIGRHHIDRPVSRRAKYSAAFEDEDEDMEDARVVEHKALEEAAMKAPAFELPAGFTFAKETPIVHDLTHAKEPPITSLPFSLTKPVLPPAPAPVLPAVETAKLVSIPVPQTPAPALPTISLVPPTPETGKVATEAPSLPATAAPSAGMPIFFTKPAAGTTSPFLSVPTVGQAKRAEVLEPNVPKVADGAPSSSLFGSAAQSTSVFAAPISGFPPASATFGGSLTPSKEAEKPTTTAGFTFGAPEKTVEAGAAPTPSLPSGQPPVAEPALSSNTSSVFGASSAPPSLVVPVISTPTAPATTVEAPKSVFAFGQPASATTPASAPAPAVAAPAAESTKFLFGTPPPATPFSFGPSPGAAAAKGKPPTSLFSSDASSTAEKKPVTSPFSFEASSAAEKKPAPSPFSFEASSTTEKKSAPGPFSFETSSTAEKKPAPSPFSFEASSTAVKKPAAGPFSFDPSSTAEKKPAAGPFSFEATTTTEKKPAASPFSFDTSSTAEKKTTSGFAFGSSPASTAPAAAASTFGFGTPSGSATDVSSKPFTFGSTAPARPATPPKAVQDEVTMDESPTREMVLNGNGKAPERPTLNFSFSTPTGSALFAQSPATTTTPFNFGGSGVTVNPFAKEEKKETKPAVSFSGFGQPSSTGFSFGQKPPESPATTAPFQFTQPSPSVAPTSPFSFNAAPTSANPFGQSSTASAPTSPSTFSRPASFAFGTPTVAQPAASPFSFGAGSQPASPATGTTTLPSGTTGSTPFTFGAGANAAAQAGGSLFTMGSAPPPADGAGGRRIKGLPRRGAARR